MKTTDFKTFNGQEQALLNQGIYIFGPKASAAQDFALEYITLNAAGKTA